MTGARGIAQETLAPSGYILVRGELWRAEVMGSAPPIDKGKKVQVTGIRGLTLLVQPYNKEDEAKKADDSIDTRTNRE